MADVSEQTLAIGLGFMLLTLLSLQYVFKQPTFQLQTTVPKSSHASLHLNSSSKFSSIVIHSLEALDNTLGMKLQTNFSEQRLSNLDMFRQVAFNSREELYNPSLLSTVDALWMYARFEGRNRTGAYTLCPQTSLTTFIPCPVQDIRMISFVVRCRLNHNLVCK
jgi:hypothetical protein